MNYTISLEPQKKSASRRTKRFNLFAQGKFVVGLDLETVLKEKLEEGKEISESELKRLIKISGKQKILEKIFHFLSYRPRSEKEVYDFLLRKKVDEEEIKSLLTEIKKNGYLNDEEFTRWWIEQRTTFRPTGRRLLDFELRRKGIAKEIINRQLDARVEQQMDEHGQAKKAAEKKLRSLQNLPLEKARDKIFSALARRGFDIDVIKEVVDEIYKKK